MPNPTQPKPWEPNVEIYRTRSALVVRVELAGMKREEIQVTYDGTKFRIFATRRVPPESSEGGFLAKGIRYGPYEAIVQPPPGYNNDEAKANYHTGMLRLEIPIGEAALRASATLQVRGIKPKTDPPPSPRRKPGSSSIFKN